MGNSFFLITDYHSFIQELLFLMRHIWHQKTEKDMQAQEEQLNALKEELSRLDQKFDAQLKAMGLTEDDLKQQEPMTPEVEALVAKAKEKAKRAGEARKAQAALDNRPSGKAPGAGRRGVVRL